MFATGVTKGLAEWIIEYTLFCKDLYHNPPVTKIFDRAHVYCIVPYVTQFRDVLNLFIP